MANYFPVVGLDVDEVETKIDRLVNKYGNSCYKHLQFHAGPIIEFQDLTGLSTVHTGTQQRYFSLCSIEPVLEQRF